MNLLDLIPVWATVIAAPLALLVVYALLRRGVMRSIVDPAAPVFFQLLFTFFILMFTGLLEIQDAIGIFLFLVVIAFFPIREAVGTQFITSEQWLDFSKYFVLMLLIMNVVLIKERGLLFMSDDIEVARQEFFQGAGIFRRFNEAGAGITTITAAFLWERRNRKSAIIFGLIAACISLTLGSRSSLLLCLFAYGTYLHFIKRKVSNLPLIAAGALFSLASLGIFFLMYGAQFLLSFGYRLLAECDGPFYFFYDSMHLDASAPLGYPLDILATSLRLRAAPVYEPLGEYILQRHFHVDILQGPNPQMLVESHVLFHSFGTVWYLLCAVLFVYLRKHSHNPYSFYFSMSFAGPLLIDSQYAFSQIFTALIIFSLLACFVAFRWMIEMTGSIVHREDLL